MTNLIAAAVAAEAFILAQSGSDPTGGFLTSLASLGVAGLLATYLYIDNNRLRKDLAAEREATARAEVAHIAAIEEKAQERARIQVDMLARYERLIPLEQEGQRIHTESIKVLEQALAVMNQMAGRPTLDPDLAAQLIRLLKERP